MIEIPEAKILSMQINETVTPIIKKHTWAEAFIIVLNVKRYK